MSILISIVVLGGLTLLLAIMLVVANRFLYVYEDPRIDEVENMLPLANCGACGFPGCRPFAEALVSGKVLPGKCTVNTAEGRLKIAQYLGVDAGTQEKSVARLACGGGNHVAVNRAKYEGLATCRAASLISGGGKGCYWGCLGLGDCAQVCDFDAIHLDIHGLPVVDVAKCTACGDCVEVCPKDLFSLQPVSRQLWVACKSLDAGDVVLAECDVGCTACGKCAMDAPDVIRIENQLPIIQYPIKSSHQKAIDRCPTGAIVWLESDGTATKGGESKKIFRQGEKKMETS